jgi:uncharacterized protein with ParB-like and HNH nuclease domain
MPTKLVAHEQAIARIFSSEYVFKIPAYQRPYAWTTEQARELLDDLIEFMKARPGEIDEMPPYFLGSIVLIKTDTLPDSDVVDGQQRLTTLTLLLSVIRTNARLFVSRIQMMSEPERLRLAQFMVTRCYLVTVATPDLNSAFRIFSVLNTRGLNLEGTDILKAQIVGGLPEQQRKSYTERWEDIEEELGRVSFGELFSHIRMIYRKAKPQGTLLTEFREHVLKEMQPDHFIDDVLNARRNQVPGSMAWS